ncbi:MAG: ribosomal protein S18-alanine N-acetyltransferase [Deltaproteobacteria bacterium]|nr:ribosomal protein S18-alanine N-acetyltransferase [Deltaproteobacteria bacterium]
MTLEPLIAADLEKILEIENRCFSEPYSRELWEEELKLDVAHPFVLKKDNQIVAYLDFWAIRGEAQLIKIAVDPVFQRQGLGAYLLRAFEEKCREQKVDEILLEVRPSNQSAIALYKKMGFEKVRVRKKYYSDNQEDAWEMTKRLY